MHHRALLTSLVTTLLIGASCSHDALSVEERAEQEEQKESPREVLIAVRNPSAAFTTDQGRYFIRTTSLGHETEIPWSYRNDTGRTIYVATCNDIAPPVLQKREGDRWVDSYVPIVPLCLGPINTIAPGATYRRVLEVFAGLAGTNRFPQFQVSPLDGVYRLVWHSVLWSFDEDTQTVGEPLPLKLRTSEPFVLQRAR